MYETAKKTLNGIRANTETTMATDPPTPDVLNYAPRTAPKPRLIWPLRQRLRAGLLIMGVGLIWEFLSVWSKDDIDRKGLAFFAAIAAGLVGCFALTYLYRPRKER